MKKNEPGDYLAAKRILSRMLKLSAKPNSTDSYGNSCLMRAMLAARQRVVADDGFPEQVKNRALRSDLRAVLRLLVIAGAKPNSVPRGNETTTEFAAREPALADLLPRATTSGAASRCALTPHQPSPVDPCGQQPSSGCATRAKGELL